VRSRNCSGSLSRSTSIGIIKAKRVSSLVILDKETNTPLWGPREAQIPQKGLLPPAGGLRTRLMLRYAISNWPRKT